MTKKTSLLFFVISAVLFLPVFVSAQTIEGIIENIVTRVVWPVAVGCVVIFWVVTGILFLAALGSPDKLKLERTSLIMSVAGTVVIIIAASAMTIIGNALL